MLSSILIRHLLASLPNILPKRRINDQLLSNRVAGQLPRKLVLPSRRLVVVFGVENVVVVLLEFAVVLGDGVDDVLVHLFIGGEVRHVDESCLDRGGFGDLVEEVCACDGAWNGADGEHCEWEEVLPQLR